MSAAASGDWTRDEVNAQLSRILRSPEFERNKSVSSILSFVVEETLEGRGARLKAYTIGVEIFAREGTFDAQNNSIVRVQAARLRQLLEIYYTGVGADDPIHISMPVGGYKVLITRAFRDEPKAQAPPDDPASQEREADRQDAIQNPPSRPERTRGDWRFAICVAALVSTLSLMLLQRFGPPSQTAGATEFSRPRVSVKLAAAAANPRVERLADAVERGLSAFDDIDVTADENAPGSSPAAYRLFIDAAPSRESGVNLIFKLARASDGVLVWSKEFANADPGGGDVADIAATVSQAVGDLNGAVNLDRIARMKPWPERPSGQACVLASEEAIRDWAPEKLRRAENCLEAELAADPDNANAQGLLADVLVRRSLNAPPGGEGPQDLRRASRLARQAYDHDARRARAAYTLFLTQFYDGRFDEAFAAGLKAMEINPNASVYAAQIGAALISRGDYARGEKLIGRMEGVDRPPLGLLSAWLALAALMQGDDARFQQLARAPGMEVGPLGLILRMAEAPRLADGRQEGDQAALLLRERFPGVAADIPAALRRYALAPEIVARLTADLKLAEPLAVR